MDGGWSAEFVLDERLSWLLSWLVHWLVWSLGWVGLLVVLSLLRLSSYLPTYLPACLLFFLCFLDWLVSITPSLTARSWRRMRSCSGIPKPPRIVLLPRNEYEDITPLTIGVCIALRFGVLAAVGEELLMGVEVTRKGNRCWSLARGRDADD